MTKNNVNHGIIILLEFYPSWLALPREKRRQLAGDLYSIIGKLGKRINFLKSCKKLNKSTLTGF